MSRPPRRTPSRSSVPRGWGIWLAALLLLGHERRAEALALLFFYYLLRR